MRPERRFKPGMDGGLRAAVLVSPPHHLRAAEILSKRWGPPQNCCMGARKPHAVLMEGFSFLFFVRLLKPVQLQDDTINVGIVYFNTLNDFVVSHIFFLEAWR